MWFKNLCVYRLTAAFEQTPEQLAERLADFGFQPVPRTEEYSRGWVAPLGRPDQPLVHATGSQYMICLQDQQRLLPASVIKETVDERAAEIEQREHRRLGRSERTRLKEEVTLELLPQAFTRSRRHYAYLDTHNGYLAVDATTWKAAEELTELLRTCLGSLPMRPLQTEHNPQQVMTDWLAKGNPPGDLELGDEAILEDPRNEAAEVRVKRLDLQSSEVTNHVEAGKRARRLAVAWNERLGCVIDADLSIKRLKFLDVVQDDADDREPESQDERFDADFAIMTLELARFLPRLTEYFGGEPSATE